MQSYIIILSLMTSFDEILLKEHRNKLLIGLGKKIQESRLNKGLSQTGLAAKMLGEFDATNISRIESGRTNPTIFTLYKISIALDIPLSELIKIN